ncbi:MAG: prepilin peptidase [Lachnospiraceae bacterium]|nr:prepilin peptidase [Lachnospiraceae bacterium]
MQQMRQIREMIALAMLAVSSYTDIKEKSIYIMPLVITSSGAVIISLTELVSKPAADVFTHDLLMPALTGIIFIAVIYTYREHIGMGDAYLLAALLIIAGIRYSLYTIAVSLLLSSVYALIVLAAGRIGGAGSRTIPFAPFVLTGFLLVLTMR